MNKIFVIGSGTGVGKTILSLLLMRGMAECGQTPHYYKWIQTGCRSMADQGSDASVVSRLFPILPDRYPTFQTGCFLAAPKAPLYAAREAGYCLEEETCLNGLSLMALSQQFLVVESAGGLMVPVTEQCLNIDLLPHALEMGFSLVMATGVGLGSINHTLLSLEALGKRNLPLAGLFMLVQPDEDADVLLIDQNRQAIETFGRQVDGIIPALDPADPPCGILAMLTNFLCLS